jgi:flavin-dependent dehydrogenase
VAIKRIAIIGAGPCGASLAQRLHQAGKTVLVFSSPERPGLLVGESLIPGVVPLLAELGVEEAVSLAGTLKGGAVLALPEGIEWTIKFSQTQQVGCDYAYNISRRIFDDIIVNIAIKNGVKVILQTAKVQLVDEQFGIKLIGDSATAFRECTGGDPDLIIDASGRSRVIGRLCAVPFTRSKRSDTVWFSHFTDVPCPHPGYIHVDIFSEGWIWRIPLPDAVSVGGVFPTPYWDEFGAKSRLKLESLLAKYTTFMGNSKNYADSVVGYSNYNLVSEYSSKANWVLVGDAFGFLDPVFSSGVLLALTSAKLLADCIISEKPLRDYEAAQIQNFDVWKEVIESFYDGSFFSMIRSAYELSHSLSARERRSGIIGQEIEGVIARLISGISTPEDRKHFAMIKAWSGIIQQNSIKLRKHV